MTDVDRLLQDLSEAARSDAAPNVDVRIRVSRTIATQASASPGEPLPLDVLPLAFTGIALALAASAIFAFLPAWRTMFEPWAGYFPG